MSVQVAFQGPHRGADRAVLLAHGAGSDMHAVILTMVADGLAAAGIPSLRFNFPYRTAGRRAPDRAPVLAAAMREAVEELSRRSRLDPGRLVLAGRSMGGRYGSIVVADEEGPVPALGLVLLGYPLHPAGRPEQLRVTHFPRLSLPVLFVSGTRDALAPQASLEREAKAIPGPVTFHWIDTADHGFRPLKRSGLTYEGVLTDVGQVVARFVAGLRGSTTLDA